MKLLRIKDLVKAVDTPAQTIRYYERSGLLPEAKRTENNYRIYDQEDVSRLRFIRNCRALDMSLDEVRELIDFMEQAPQQAESSDQCGGVHAVIEAHLEHVQHRLKSLHMLEKQLQKLLHACDQRESSTACEMLHSLFSDMDIPKSGKVQGVHTT